MGVSSRSVEKRALRWARRALQADSPEEALWWAARAYGAAPTSPSIRAVVRRIRRRFPNAQGRSPAHWPGWASGLFLTIAIFLIAWGWGVIDSWLFAEQEAFPIPEAVALDPTPDPAADLRKRHPGDPLSGARPKGMVPAEMPLASTPPPAPSPTLPPSPTSAPHPTAMRTARPTATVASRPRPSASPTPFQGPPFPGRWMLVDLSDQELMAYEGETLILKAKVSTGRPRTPTVIGTFRIYLKLRAQTMSGPGYRLPNVPYVMYFYQGYALHGTYWHNNFGRPMSHGCVNLPIPIAEQLYRWADIGTPVVVQP